VFYSNYKRREAGIITVLRNRVGDVFIMLLSAFLVLNAGFNFLNCVRRRLGLLLVISAITKRAMWPYCS